MPSLPSFDLCRLENSFSHDVSLQMVWKIIPTTTLFACSIRVQTMGNEIVVRSFVWFCYRHRQLAWITTEFIVCSNLFKNENYITEYFNYETTEFLYGTHKLMKISKHFTFHYNILESIITIDEIFWAGGMKNVS